MRFFTLLLLFSFASVAVASYFLLALNTGIVQIDLLFIELPLSIGKALLIFFTIGFLITVFLELMNGLRKAKLKE